MHTKTQHKKSMRASAARIFPLQLLWISTPLTMIAKTKATILTGYAGQKHATMVSHR